MRGEYVGLPLAVGINVRDFRLSGPCPALGLESRSEVRLADSDFGKALNGVLRLTMKL
ncbi:hypothetical protein FBZ89_12263 [Nitrospirillum amazonense]|uniref:Uncharacterized protein n=1 Tax=Nitrospirillum amazonense TaxID=28077 RepID=A0A560EUA2_9PROT|nr:hypothetical protein FBZ89_12263 [Nitrospirillum amazonense]